MLRMPEYYSVPEALPRSLGTERNTTRPLHLVFRSTEQIRLLKFGYNIACFAWEFDILKDDTRYAEHPFRNQVHMLTICDEVWTLCSYTRDILLRHNVTAVHIVPAPIEVKKRRLRSRSAALAQVSTLSVSAINHNPYWSLEDSIRANQNSRKLFYESISLISPQPEIYISVFNPEDHRKNMNAMLLGFYFYHQQNQNAVLLVKLVTSLERHNMDPAAMTYRLLANKLTDPNILQSAAILFITDYLSIGANGRAL